MNDLTVGDVIQSLGFRDWPERQNGRINFDPFTWPPDVFAMAATVLRDSGAYLHAARARKYEPGSTYWLHRWVINQDNPRKPTGYVAAIARKWRLLKNLPVEVKRLLTRVADLSHIPLWQLSRHDPNNFDWLPFLELLCIADQTCRGIGLLWPLYDIKHLAEQNANTPLNIYPYDSVVCSEAMRELFNHPGLPSNKRTIHRAAFGPTTLCKEIAISRAIVLPKMRTSQRGVTIRSFSHHLSLLNGTDVEPHWHPTNVKLLENQDRQKIMRVGPQGVLGATEITNVPKEAGPYNIILFPWPDRIHPSQFRPMCPIKCLADRPPPGDQFFKFEPRPLDVGQFRKKVRQLYGEAFKLVGPIHGFVMPEMAMRETDFRSVFKPRFLPEIEFVACGIYEPNRKNTLADNYAIIRRAEHWGSRTRFEYHWQYKHHRWALDPSQVATYRLGSALRPGVTWWEGIDLPRRVLHFFALDASAAFTVLICEDLARPDPVADAVRAVGPNLVICLLLDGPQLTSRWSARYATVLADDPGSSVITLSSLGMVRLSRTRDGLHKESRIIGLWREPGGPPVELHLDEGADALVLSLSSKGSMERTVDGRGDEGVAGELHLTGVHPLYTQQKRTKSTGR